MTEQFERIPCLRFLLVAILGLAGCAATPQGPSSEVDLNQIRQDRERVISAMSEELERSIDKLKFRDYEPPYFIAYAIEDNESASVSGKYGSLTDDSYDRRRFAYVEVRVGDYKFDNFANVEGESFRMTDYEADRSAPLDDNSRALQGTLWLLTDETYKKAVSDYLTKRGASVYDSDQEKEVASFSKEPPVQHRDEIQPLVFDRERWTKIVKEISGTLTQNSEVLSSSMDVSANRIIRYFVNSEGTELIKEQVIYSIQISAWSRAEDGMLLDNGRTFYARSHAELPSEEFLRKESAEMVNELLALREAPVLDPYSGPAILAPEAAGVLFHEVIGHRLEGERQRNEEEGRTFKGRIGKKVLPEFLTVRDDPTTSSYQDQQLNGFYEYDDEGVKATNVILIKEGVLKSYLKSRTPIEGSPTSNGHGRAQGIRKPIARMSNLIVEAAEDHQVPSAELKKRLIAEVKRQNKPFGLIIRDITGGSTNTSGWGYQAFKGTPRLIYKVDPETGAETLVRGVELVGTPLTSINKIVAASAQPDIFNGYCGAESGYVPVSTVAPALLTTEIELQRKQQNKQRAPILPPPWKSEKKSP